MAVRGKDVSALTKLITVERTRTLLTKLSGCEQHSHPLRLAKQGPTRLVLLHDVHHDTERKTVDGEYEAEKPYGMASKRPSREAQAQSKGHQRVATTKSPESSYPGTKKVEQARLDFIFRVVLGTIQRQGHATDQ